MKPKFFVIHLKFLLAIVGMVIITAFIILVFFNLIDVAKMISNDMPNVKLI